MAWARRNLLEAYDRVGLRDPKWDDAARRFTEMSLSLSWSGSGRTRRPTSRSLKGEQSLTWAAKILW